MWEADKEVLKAYKECYRNLLTEMREGEGDVDIGSACQQETTALQNATQKASQWYKDHNPMNVPERRQGYYNPQMPYFQNM